MNALILMSTYNGEAFLEEQLDSIRKQDYTDWNLIIRDDGSTDNTLNIIQRYCLLDKRISYLTDTLGNLKAAQSFGALLSHAKNRSERFIFFADQDDVWKSHKLTLQISLLQKNDERIPLLVFTDLQVVNQKLETISSSFLNYESLAHTASHPLRRLLIHNWLTGCTLGFNRALLNAAIPIPSSALMHDWWIALCAASQGKIYFCKEATVLYRQHEKNEVGSKGWRARMKKIISWQTPFVHYINSFHSRFSQAYDLLNHLKSQNPNISLIQSFCTLPQQPALFRLLIVLKNKIYPAGWFRKVGFFILLFRLDNANSE